MIILGLILACLLVGGSAYLAGQAIQHARAAGTLAATPKTGTKAVRAKTTARNAPHNVRTIMAQAWADNYVAKRAHIRDQKAAVAPPPATPPAAVKPPRRPLLERLTSPGRPLPGVGPEPAPAAQPAPAPRRADGRSPAVWPPARPAEVPRQPPVQPRLVPVPDPPSGRTDTMTTTAPPSAAPTGAAADMFSAASTLNGHARAGGIHGKLRGEKVYGEALAHIAAALEQFARDMQETGRYPAMTWEPVITAAAHVRAGGLAMGEAVNALSGLMKMPLGELAASPVRAPHHDELNRA